MTKLRLKKKNAIIAGGILLFLSIEIINPSKLFSISKVEKYAYSKDSAIKIVELGLKSKVLESKYSSFIDTNIFDNNFNIAFFDFYKEIDYSEKIDLSLVNELKEKGYLSKDVTCILNSGDEKAIKELLKKDKIVDISDYLSFSYSKLALLDRYIEYKKINGVKYETAVTYVNIGLDKEFYTDYNEVNTFSYTMLINKYNRLSDSFTPLNLVEFPKDYCNGTSPQNNKEVVDAFVKMADDMKKENLVVLVNSAYRSYADQEEIYNKYTKLYGANYNVAKPGFSEHQTGLSIDLHSKSSSEFKGSKEEAWIKENGYKYGFILRYDASKVKITGYNEPWHIRYVGKEIAEDIKNKKITYDEYYVKYIEEGR